jgi:hypothetical protein
VAKRSRLNNFSDLFLSQPIRLVEFIELTQHSPISFERRRMTIHNLQFLKGLFRFAIEFCVAKMGRLVIPIKSTKLIASSEFFVTQFWLLRRKE